MPRISIDTIQQVKGIDVAQVLPVDFKREGKQLVGICCFHEEKTPSLNVFLNSNSYYCFGCEESGDIITAYRKLHGKSFTEAVLDLANVNNIPVIYDQDDQGTKEQVKTVKKTQKDSKLDLAYNENLKVDSTFFSRVPISELPPSVKKELPPNVDTVAMTIYHYSEFQQIRRYDWVDLSKQKGRDKTFRPFSFNTSTEQWVSIKGDREWHAYKINDVCKNSGKWVLGAEGEKCADSLIRKGFYTLAWPGCGNDKDAISRTLFNLKQSEIQGLIYFVDNDQPGLNKAEKIKKYGADNDFEVILIKIQDIWNDCPVNGDIADYLSQNPDISSQDLINIITEQVENISKAKQPAKQPTKQESKTKTQSKSKTGDVDYEQIQEICLSNNLTSQKMEDLRRVGISTSSANKYIETFDNELVLQSEKKQLVSSFSNMSDIRKQDINLDRYLFGDNGRLAKAFKIVCKGSLVPEINMFITLLSAAAPFIGKKSNVWVSKETEWSEPCVFWTAIVGESGSNKSFPGKLILSILQEMDEKEYKSYTQELAEYEKIIKSDPTATVEKPIRKRFLSKDATVASLESILSTSEGSLTYWKDELSGLVATRNRSGNGGDVQYELQEWNGGGIITDRAEKTRQICISKTSVSRTGTIQFDVLKDIAGDFRDSNGWFARWLFSVVESGQGFLDIVNSKDESTGVKDMLRQLFRDLQKLPSEDYQLSIGAKLSFQNWFNLLKIEERKETLEGLKLAYAKLQAYTARLALWLHCVNATLAGENPDTYITQETMDLAVELSQFFLRQVKFIHNVHSPDSGLMGHTFRVYDLIQKRPDGVTAAQIKSYRFGRSYKTGSHLTTGDIRLMCEDLVTSGYVSKTGTGTNAIYFDNRYQNFDMDVKQVKQPIINGSEDSGLESFDNFDMNLTSMSNESNNDAVRVVDIETKNFDILTQDSTHSLNNNEEDIYKFEIGELAYLIGDEYEGWALIESRSYEYEDQKVLGNITRAFRVEYYDCVIDDDRSIKRQRGRDLVSMDAIDKGIIKIKT